VSVPPQPDSKKAATTDSRSLLLTKVPFSW